MPKAPALTPDQLRASDDPFLSALLSARDARKQRRLTFVVEDVLVPQAGEDGAFVLDDRGEFILVPLAFDCFIPRRTDIEKARQAATRRGEGLDRAVETRDDAETDCRLIVNMTVPEDLKRLWGNNAYMRALGVAEPWRMVNEVVPAGQIVRIGLRLMERAGFKEPTVADAKSEDSD